MVTLQITPLNLSQFQLLNDSSFEKSDPIPIRFLPTRTKTDGTKVGRHPTVVRILPHPPMLPSLDMFRFMIIFGFKWIMAIGWLFKDLNDK
jgi:hypothetical protein